MVLTRTKHPEIYPVETIPQRTRNGTSVAIAEQSRTKVERERERGTLGAPSPKPSLACTVEAVGGGLDVVQVTDKLHVG